MHRGGPAVPWQAGGRLQVPLTPQRVRVVRGTAVKPGRHTYCATAPAAVDENCTSAWTTWGGGQRQEHRQSVTEERAYYGWTLGFNRFERNPFFI